MNKWIALAVMLVVPAFVRAQSTEGKKPSEPILKRAASNAEWTVYFYQDRGKAQELIAKQGLNLGDGDVAEGSNFPKSLTVSKSGNTYREIVRKGNGQTVEKWSVNGLQVYELPESKQIARSILPSSSMVVDNYSDYRRSDFEALEWIGKDNFRGVKEVAGREVFEFRTDSIKRRLTPRELSGLIDPDSNKSAAETQLAQENQADGSAGYTAYLDIRTQLPLYFDDGKQVRIYKFSESAPGNLALPPQFAAEMKNWQKELDRRRPLPKP